MHFTLGVVLENIFDLYDRVERYVQGFEDDEALEESPSPSDGNGRHGDEINLNAEMDGFETGGRWRGSLLVKAEVTDFFLSNPSISGENTKPREVLEGYRWVDVARIKDIEWQKMLELERPIKFRAFLGLDEDWMEIDKDNQAELQELLKSECDNCFFAVVDCHV